MVDEGTLPSTFCSACSLLATVASTNRPESVILEPALLKTLTSSSLHILKKCRILQRQPLQQHRARDQSPAMSTCKLWTLQNSSKLPRAFKRFSQVFIGEPKSTPKQGGPEAQLMNYLILEAYSIHNNCLHWKVNCGTSTLEEWGSNVT